MRDKGRSFGPEHHYFRADVPKVPVEEDVKITYVAISPPTGKTRQVHKHKPLTPDEQRLYDETAQTVENGDFSQAFGNAAVQLHRFEKKTDANFKSVNEQLKTILERLPEAPKP